MSENITPETDVASLFGTNNYENSPKKPKTKYFSLKQPDKKKGEESTTFICKILPAMHSGKTRQGVNWACRTAVHWGYSVIDDKDPTKTYRRTFKCVEKSFNKVVQVACPECELLEKYTNEAADIKAEYEKAGKAQELETHKRYQFLTGFVHWQTGHRLDVKYKINVMTADGEFGVLKVSTTTFKDLKAWMDRYRKENGVDPADPNGGVWLKFTSTGQSRDKRDTWEVVQETVVENGKKYKMDKDGKLTQQQMLNAVELCPDLFSPDSPVLTVEQVQELVDSEGDLDKTTAIFKAAKGDVAEEKEEGSANSGPMTADQFVKQFA